MVSRFRRGFILVAVLLAGLLLLSCGDNGEDADETPEASPAATEAADGETPTTEEVPGVTDTEILLGAHFPLSQNPAAAYAPIADGMRAYFDYVNSQGGVHGRKITFLVGDDHFNPSDTVEVTRKLVEQDGIFAMVGGLGDAPHTAVWKYLEENGVPDMFIGGGLDKWTEPLVRTRFQGNPNYGTEEAMIAKYLIENFDGKKLGILIENDEFGENGKEALLEGIEDSDIELVAEERYETVAWDVSAQAQRLKAANPDVIFAMAVPPPAASLVKTARETLDWDVPIIVTGVVVTDIFIDLAGAENAEGVVSVVFGKQIYQTDDPGVQQVIQIYDEFGPGGEASNFSLYGMFIAEMMVEALENAGPNLTRDSLIDGAESIRDWCCMSCPLPVNLSPTDHRPCEMEVYNKVEDGKWVAFGDPVIFESTPGEAVACAGPDQPIYEDGEE